MNKAEAMFRAFAREIKSPLLANMTEFGRTPHFTARQFEEFGFKMVIWPVSSLRVAAKAVGIDRRGADQKRQRHRADRD